jgi:hypothetical protein
MKHFLLTALSIASLSTTLACSTQPSSSSASAKTKSDATIHTNVDEDREFTRSGDETLTDILNYDYLNIITAETLPAKICFKGDRNKVCSLMSEFSKRAETAYTDGLHELVKLDGCFLQGKSGKPVIAQLKAIHDYEDKIVSATISIEQCEPSLSIK